ncbi:MAG: HD domain-containing phosphohydrolase [Syntrophobacteraceae bacterium]
MKILIVEDDSILCDLLREYLQQLQHERVQTCYSAQDALVAIKEEVYDCAFVDLRLPDMDGIQLIGILKIEDPSLPIVMMSGYPTMSYTIEAMRKGASDFLPKPFTLQDMVLALERVTKERKLLLENLGLKLEIQAQQQLERVNRELKAKVDEQIKLFEISAQIDAVRSSEDLYPRLVQMAASLTAAEKVGFFILPPDQHHVILISEFGLDDIRSSGCYPRLETEELRSALENTAGHFPLRRQDIFRTDETSLSALDDCLYYCWPLRIRGELFGFLATSGSAHRYDQSGVEVKLLDFLMKKAALAIENMALYESMVSNFYGILRSLVNALEAKDRYTGKHSERVTRYAYLIAQEMGCGIGQVEALRTVGHLHDIGKIGIADSILNKPTALTQEEYELVRKHPVIGESIVSELGLSPEERAIIRHHHECWDGSGYPDGLSGQEIPLLARIVMVADAFDAMTSKRAYRAAMSKSAALHELERNCGRQFDREVVSAFVSAAHREL